LQDKHRQARQKKPQVQTAMAAILAGGAAIFTKAKTMVL
jgi:hypothetical protein